MAKTKTPAQAPKLAAQAPAPAANVATVAPVASVPAGLHGGIPLATLPRHIVAMGAGIGKLAPALAPVALAMGPKVPKGMRAHQCVQWWAVVQAQVAAGSATYSTLAGANVPAHFVRYCVRSGWLAQAAPATA